MKIAPKLALGALAAMLAACGSSAPADEAAVQDPAPTDPVLADAGSLPAGAVRHVVVFRFREDAPEEQIQQVTDAFRELQHKIPGILAFEHGRNHSPEGKDQGFDHVYTITFENAAARDAYLPHPDHAAFGQLLGRLSVHEDVFVVDYDPQP